MSSGAARAAQLHYWSLTRKRIGTRFLGLDHAGNILLYPAYRSTWFGGWLPVTMSFQTTRPQTMLMEDGYPMHHKSSSKLQQTVIARQKDREKRLREHMEANIKRKLQASNNLDSTPASEIPEDLEDDVAFIKRVARDCSEPSFVRSFLRVNRFATTAYLSLYYALWGCGLYVLWRWYCAFKAWLNPPARNGIENLERKVMYYPRCIQELVEYYVISLEPVQYLIEAFDEYVWQPVKDTMSPQLAQFRVRWASQHERERKRQEHDAAMQHAKELRDAQRRTWWERSIVSLLLAIIFVCFL